MDVADQPPDADRYGPWAVVAGASVGLGAAFASEVAGRGINLVTIARRRELLEEQAEELRRRHGVEVRPLATDLMARDLGDVVSEATSDLDLGLLVYNATIAPTGPFLDIDVDDHLDGIRVNCNGATVLAHLVGRRLRDRGSGGMAFVTSMGALQGAAVFTSYFAAKAYDWILAEGLWSELRHHGIDVVSYVVGATMTPNFEGAGGERGVTHPECTEVADHFETTLNRVRNPAEPAYVASGLFGALPNGPTAFSVDVDRRSAERVLAMSRRDAVESMSRLTLGKWGDR